MLKSATLPNGSVTKLYNKLRFVVEGIFRSFGKDSPRLPQLSSLDQVRKFCTGLAERSQHHPWAGIKVEKKLTAKQFQTLSHSLFLFRKIIPKPSDPSAVDSYIDKMSEEDGKPDLRFLAYLRRETIKLMEEGWDRKYDSFCDGLVLSTTGCLESKRSTGGVRRCNGDFALIHGIATGKTYLDPNLHAAVKVVRDNGKDRLVTVSSAEQFALRPFHQTLQDYLSRQEWIMNGDARARKFSGFERVKGEVFVSGDYESATDNIHLDVYKTVLHAVYASSRYIPHTAFKLAMDRSQMYLTSGRKMKLQKRGQLMGNFLSFPILCIINYLTFKYAVPRDVPVKINGDDIVFRATMGEFKKWSKGVKEAGLVLSPGKTMVDEVFFTLNSALFKSQSYVSEVPFVRSKPLFSKPETPQALSAQYKEMCPGFSGPQAAFFRLDYLKRQRKMIGMCQRSLSRGLGMYVNISLLRQTGLYRREKFYLSLPSEEPLPGKTEARPFEVVPPGFMPVRRSLETDRVWKVMKEISSSFGRACKLFSRVKLGDDDGEPITPAVKRDMWVKRLQRGTRRFRDLEKKFFSWLHIGGQSVNPKVTPPAPRMEKDTILLPCVSGSSRPGLGWRIDYREVA
nr:MAG: RNA-dependent RNA polymerase [Botourmiaviridae sp.]